MSSNVQAETCAAQSWLALYRLREDQRGGGQKGVAAAISRLNGEPGKVCKDAIRSARRKMGTLIWIAFAQVGDALVLRSCQS